MKTISTRITLLQIVFAILFAFLWASPAFGTNVSKQESLLREADKSRRSLYGSSKKMKYRHNWLNTISLYEKVYEKYPKSDQAAWSLYHTATMYRRLHSFSGSEKDLDKSLAFYQRVISEHRGHRLADDAQYKIGEIYYKDKNDPTQAYVEYLKVDIKFPSGDMHPKAIERMDEIAVILGKKERSVNKKQTSPPSNGLTTVKQIRHWSTPTYTRVVVDLERPVKYSSHLLKRDPDLNKPRRLYLDLKDTHVSSTMDSSIPIKDGILQRARAGQYKKDVVRVVLDITNLTEHKIFHLYDPFRIVVDVRGDNNKVYSKTTSKNKKRPTGKGIKKETQPDNTISLARQLGLNVKRIVIDPGHGGKDPGCYFKGGIREKNIVLDLAKTLANKIESRLGCEVMLTRTSDKFIPLDERTAFANVNKADLFISLHINAHKSKSIYGIETYILNMATDERAVTVAARENATSEKNISDLQSILNDLMLNTKITESSKLAHSVQNGMVEQINKRYSPSKSLGVKQAPFYVLIGADMPAILIETGFITNSRERQRLLNGQYREHLADGVVSGIETYIKSIEQVYTGG